MIVFEIAFKAENAGNLDIWNFEFSRFGTLRLRGAIRTLAQTADISGKGIRNWNTVSRPRANQFVRVLAIRYIIKYNNESGKPKPTNMDQKETTGMRVTMPVG